MNFEAKPQSLLTFRVGPVLCCAPSLPVRSIITPPKLTHPPGSDSSQPGIFKHGSHIVKVLDLRQKFGVEKAEQTQPGNFIITIFEKESFAFWVDQILDVFDFPTEGWANLPAAIPRGVFSRTLLLNKKIHLYSEFEKLATINDLGYLKHYIQQLKQQTSQETAVAVKKETSTSTLNKEPATTSSPENKLDKKTHKPTPELKTISPVKGESKDNIKVEKAVSSVTTKTPVVKKDKTHSVTQPISTTTSSTTKSAPSKKIAKPLSTTILNNTSRTASLEKNKTALSNSATSSAKQTIQDNNESSALGIIIFFMLLLGAMGAGIYYLLLDDTKRDYKYKKERTYISPKSNYKGKLTYDVNESDYTKTDSTSDKFDSANIESEEIAVTKEDDFNLLENKIESVKNDAPPLGHEAESIEVENIKQEELTPAQIIAEEDSNAAKPEMAVKKDSDTPLFNTDPAPIDNQAYRAEITKRDNEITITLHQSVLEEKQQPAEAVIPLKTIEETKIDETIISSPPVKKLKQEELKKEKIIKEIVHVVVKGDTLWAIAKKYVNNPFLYPELARLSNIKNPHRIYPGNRVRIRFVKN